MTDTMSASEYNAMQAKRGNKYGAKKVEIDGYTFASQAEAKRYGELKHMVAAGEIKDLRVHPVFDLYASGPSGRKIKFAPDLHDYGPALRGEWSDDPWAGHPDDWGGGPYGID